MKVSVIILTKDREAQLRRALASVRAQHFSDYEILAVNDGSRDHTQDVLEDFNAMFKNTQILTHAEPKGITASRQEALQAAAGEYVAFLDDDDEWVDQDKIGRQAGFLDANPEYVMVGGGIKIRNPQSAIEQSVFRPETDKLIRKQMLLKNCFFTSTVMVKKDATKKAGGFMSDGVDLAEDYDLWLRLGNLGKMYNFQTVYTRYTQPVYSKEKFRAFLRKQLKLVEKYRTDYPGYFLGSLILKLRLLL